MFSVSRTTKVRNKGQKDIMAVEDMNGEVRFSTHLPYPNNLSRSVYPPHTHTHTHTHTPTLSQQPLQVNTHIHIRAVNEYSKFEYIFE